MHNLFLFFNTQKEDVKTITSRITSEVDRMTELMNNILIFGEN